jgi:hypothetical protein
MTLLEKLNRIPPCICRLMAKDASGMLMSNDEIRRRTGWGKTRLRRIVSATSFKDITVSEVDAFLSACGLSWSTQRRLIWLMQIAWRNGGLQTMRHLRYKTGSQASMIKRHQKRIAKILSKQQHHENTYHYPGSKTVD